MESAMLHGFMHLLETAMSKSQWDISGAAPNTGAIEEGHDEAGPRYLQ
jgi:hypothetical protein